MTPDQIADLALRAGRDMRRVERVRALLDGREWVPPAEVWAALEGGHQDHRDARMEVATSRANDSPPAPSSASKQPDRTTPW